MSFNINLDLNSVMYYLTSPDIQQRLFFVKIGFFALSGILSGVIVYVILTSHYMQWLFVDNIWEFITFRPLGLKRITRTWNKVLRRLETGLESEYKLAVIEADDILEATLKRMGYSGATLEERLEKLTSAILSNIEDVRKAHQIRNNIIRTPDFRLNFAEARNTLDIYRQAFDSLQILT
ncbi:MAG: hypothetical protein A2896_02610 [Candidatus Nealsonbacteria bacterium RIFCSPLOWO2_01_FULL_43_32]|uniref:Uncharacterized protein n=1 Tax=Candidatus Nealsonbacteria bacterium RIFCSPLOWO2_01_FULL_43_32 TaxID=1801672 RepID=A0A1G2EG37_9BACT|nr:MAG: hypothetical protein A2896_02610 [Candidatus Nealsonbacteria bacterium RIFCSPLOWO2_01_FULL_43_32]